MTAVAAKPGPKPSEFRAMLRQMFSEWSERRFATYYGAYCTQAEMKDAGYIGQDDSFAIIRASTRANGSLNVCKFARITEWLVWHWVTEQEKPRDWAIWQEKP